MEFLIGIIAFMSSYADVSAIGNEPYIPFTQEEIVESEKLIDEEEEWINSILDDLIANMK